MKSTSQKDFLKKESEAQIETLCFGGDTVPFKQFRPCAVTSSETDF